MNIKKLKVNPSNPRIIKDHKFQKLKKSIQDFPEMMVKRPMVCVTDKADGKIYPLGGNMRLKALQELKYKEIPDNWIMMADDWTEEQRKEFIIKDNVSFGEWDFDVLFNDWGDLELEDWGIDMPNFGGIDEPKVEKETKEIKPYKQTHILISFSPEKILDLKSHLDEILKIEGIEYEQTSN